MQICNALNVPDVLSSVDVFDPFYGLGAVRKCTHDFVIWRNGRIGDTFVLELDCVAESIAPCVLDMTFVCAIVFRGGC